MVGFTHALTNIGQEIEIEVKTLPCVREKREDGVGTSKEEQNESMKWCWYVPRYMSTLQRYVPSFAVEVGIQVGRFHPHSYFDSFPILGWKIK